MEHKLILAVSGFPSLYDTNSPTYRDLNMRADSWRHVSDIVGVPGTFFDLLQRRTGCVPCVLCPPGVHRVSIGCPAGVHRVSNGFIFMAIIHHLFPEKIQSKDQNNKSVA